MTVLLLLVGFGFGLMGGMVLDYFMYNRSLSTNYNKLVHTLTFMKRQGFVPQFDIEQPKVHDPADNVSEF